MPTLPTLNIVNISALFGVVLVGLGFMWAVVKAILLFKSH